MRLQDKLQAFYSKLWFKYKAHVENAILGNAVYEVRDITYWQNRLFANTVLYALPVSLFVVFPSIVLAYGLGYRLIPVLDIFILFVISFISLSKSFSLFFKKVNIALILTVFAIILMYSLGSFGMGSIYLLSIGVFIALLLPPAFANASIVVNVLLYVVSALIIYYKPFDCPLVRNYTIEHWTAYSLSFLFLDLITLLQIRHIINGLESTIIEEVRLHEELQAEVTERIYWNELLKESESHYKSLFLMNPSPMWIYDTETLSILQVNEVAQQKYGYTEREFLTMTIKEIRPEQKVKDLLEHLYSGRPNSNNDPYITVHKHNNGSVFFVEVRCSSITFKGKDARLVIARNITTQIEHNQAIEKQNKMLREIAFMQSHIVRAPLARIMGLADLLSQDVNEKPDPLLLEYLKISTQEFDEVIRNIVNKSTEVIPEMLNNDFLKD